MSRTIEGEYKGPFKMVFRKDGSIRASTTLNSHSGSYVIEEDGTIELAVSQTERGSLDEEVRKEARIHDAIMLSTPKKLCPDGTIVFGDTTFTPVK